MRSDIVHCITNKKRATMKLYHYIGKIDYAIEAIRTDELYLSLSTKFNDPFDCKMVNTTQILEANAEGCKDAVMIYVQNMLLFCNEFIEDFFANNSNFDDVNKKFLLEIGKREKITPYEYLAFIHGYLGRTESVKNFIKSINNAYVEKEKWVAIPKRVACFSEVNDSILMWAYYAKSHSGVCLEYTPTELDLNNPYYFKLFNGLTKVSYSEKQYNDIEFFECPDDINAAFFNKAQCWAHEQEWRLVLDDNIERVKFPCLTGIYLGANFRNQQMNLENEKDFLNIWKAIIEREHKIPIYECVLKDRQYSLDFREIIKW